MEKFAFFYRKKLILGARSALNIAADFRGDFVVVYAIFSLSCFALSRLVGEFECHSRMNFVELGSGGKEVRKIGACP